MWVRPTLRRHGTATKAHAHHHHQALPSPSLFQNLWWATRHFEKQATVVLEAAELPIQTVTVNVAPPDV
jgi:hypothetical protein